MANYFKNRLKSDTESTKFKIESKIFDFFVSQIKTRYGYKINIHNDFSIDTINKWIEKHDPKFEKRKKNTFGLLEDTAFFLNIDVNTFIYVNVGFGLIKADDDVYLANNNPGDTTRTQITMYIFGKKAKYIIKEIKKLTQSRINNGLVNYNVSANKNSDSDKDSFQSIITDMRIRDIDTLFYHEDTKQTIIDHIDSFFANKEIYESRNIRYKTGILLYSEPGTGKSSLATALACKYDLNMIIVDMNTFANLDVSLLVSCIDGDDKTYIVLLEDIDTIFNLNRDNNGERSIEDRKVINKLLQFLDSNNSPNNVIFIATTNKVDVLDEALLRAGRFDLKAYIGPIDKTEAIQMCKSFDRTDEQIESILSNFNDSNINQSQLQNFILESIKDEMKKVEIKQKEGE